MIRNLYKVQVVRMIPYHATFTVSAIDKAEANKLALVLACDHKFDPWAGGEAGDDKIISTERVIG